MYRLTIIAQTFCEILVTVKSYKEKTREQKYSNRTVAARANMCKKSSISSNQGPTVYTVDYLDSQVHNVLRISEITVTAIVLSVSAMLFSGQKGKSPQSIYGHRKNNIHKTNAITP